MEVRCLADYDAEINEAVRIIRQDEGHDTLLISQPPTNGPMARPAWTCAARGPGRCVSRRPSSACSPGSGFDNVADVLTMSPLLAEKYLAAA